MKDYNIMYNIGKCKYAVNYHNGESFHKDNSKFYAIAIFANKKKMNLFVKELKNAGYQNRQTLCQLLS